MELADKASQGAKWTALSSGAGALIGVVQISIVARFLAPEDFGTVAMILVVMAIANVFVTVGFSDVIVVKQEATAEQLSTLYWLNVLVGVTVYALLFVGAPLITLLIARDGVETMARVMTLTLLIGAWSVQFNAMMQRDLQLKALAMISMGARVCSFLTALIFVLNDFGVWSLIAAALISQIVTSISLLVFAVKNNWLPKFVFDFLGVVDMVHFGAYRIGAALLNRVNTRADQLAIGAFLGPTALGYYTVAFNLAIQPFSLINPVLTKVSFPVFSKVVDDNTKLLRGYRKGVRLLMAINAPLLIGLIAVAPLLIPALLGPGWEPSVYVTQILCIFVLLRSISNINIGLILAKNKYRWPLYWNLLLVFVIPTAIFVAAKLSESLIVVGWVVVGLQLFLSIMAYLLFAKRLLGNFGFELISDAGSPILTATVMAIAVIWLQAETNFVSQWFALTVMIPAGAMLYVGLSLVLQRKHVSEILWLARGKL